MKINKSIDNALVESSEFPEIDFFNETICPASVVNTISNIENYIKDIKINVIELHQTLNELTELFFTIHGKENSEMYKQYNDAIKILKMTSGYTEE